MRPTLDLIGTALGFLGAVTCVLAIVLRVMGQGAPDFMRVRAINVCIVGVAMLAAACWLKLEAK